MDQGMRKKSATDFYGLWYIDPAIRMKGSRKD